jgi:hypothetical protein
LFRRKLWTSNQPREDGLKRLAAEVRAVDPKTLKGTTSTADNVNGPYTPVVGATAPYLKVTPTGARKFYRVAL